MKTRFFFNCTLLLLIVFSMAGCKKDKNNSFAGCRINSISSAGFVAHIFYDAQGRVIRSESGSWLLTYAYIGNTSTIIRRNNGAFVERKINTINNDGLTVNIRTDNDSLGNSWSNNVYEYAGTELIKETGTSSSNPAYEINYSWLNGNLFQSESGGLVATHEYYTNELVKVGDYFASNPLNAPGHLIRNKNLLKSISYNPPFRGPLNLTYEFDAAGKIIKRTQEGITPFTSTFVYECN